MTKLKRIDNMDILTTDVQRLVDFYVGALGLKHFLPYLPEQGWAAIDLGNLTLYIFKTERSDHEAPRVGPTPQNAPGYDSIAFEVDDLEAAMADLDGKVEWFGAEPRRWEHPSGVYYRFRAFFDPDGNKLYITEPHKLAAASSGST